MSPIFEFIDYLWGIETCYRFPKRWAKKAFIDYLWGIETRSCTSTTTGACQVYRLPMRNWNRKRRNDSPPCIPVYRLPMRNWNPTSLIRQRHSIAFIDYLWGIETTTPITWCFSENSFIDYLWGIETSLHNVDSDRISRVYRLPMRNWNESITLLLRIR